MLLNKPSSPENHAHFNSLLNRPILVDAKMMGHTQIPLMMRSRSGRGWGLFFGANRRQAAGFRQGWIPREILGLPLLF